MAPLDKYTHKHVLGGTDGDSNASATPNKRNSIIDNESLDDEMGENRVYSEREKVQQRIDLGLVTSDPPYLSSPAQLCTSCGRGFSSVEYVNEVGPPLQQLGQESSERMCLQCSLTQSVILWFKTLNYINASEIHDLTPEVNKEIRKFKDTFKLRRTRSERLDMAACLLEEGNISMDEFQVRSLPVLLILSCLSLSLSLSFPLSCYNPHANYLFFTSLFTLPSLTYLHLHLFTCTYRYER